MKDTPSAQRSATVHIKDLHGRWTFLAKLTYISNMQGVPPMPKPHFPVSTVVTAAEQMLFHSGGETGLRPEFEVRWEESSG
jgi:hypothetical protein